MSDPIPVTIVGQPATISTTVPQATGGALVSAVPGPALQPAAAIQTGPTDAFIPPYSATSTGVATLSTAGLAIVLQWATSGAHGPMPDGVALTLVALVLPLGHVLYNLILAKLAKV